MTPIIEFASAVEDVVDNYKVLKKLRDRRKPNNNLEIKQKLKETDNQKELEKFK